MSHPWRSPERGWDPRSELHTLRSELGRVVGAALVGAGGGTPDVELREIDDGWAVVVRLPGVAPEEVALELDDRELCVRARSEEEVNADQGMPGTGLRTRAFEYRVPLPSQADPAQIDAVMDHGLLTVTVPRAARADRRTITVGRPMSGPGRLDGGTTGGGAGARPRPVDPAADRELHRPEMG
jgi:HSP20 family protein